MYSGSARQALSNRSLNVTANQSTSGSTPEVTIFRSKKWPFKLSFYDKPPQEEITLEDFEEWALDRLRLLADIESAGARNMKYEEMMRTLAERVKKFMPLSSDDKSGELERKRDQYSHFVLRLAFCRSEELRSRFLRAEVVLFKLRWEACTSKERAEFVKSLNFGWGVVTPEEKSLYRAELCAASHIKELDFISESFFKVHWTKVVDLVYTRRVFLKDGYAFVPSTQELSLVVAEFSSRLARALEMTAKALPRLDEDDRLLPILSNLSMGFIAGISSDYQNTGSGEAITAEMIAGLAKESFPLCMRSIQDTLRVNGHLKYDGRVMYQLFLKGIGLSIEEALIFWRKSLSTLTEDKFNKEYRYGVRFQYGLEGGRKNYTPKSCQQIISGPVPGPGQSHGCPFRHYSEANLTSTLSSTYALSTGDTKEILGAVKSGHYHVACTRLFEIQHARLGVNKGDGIGGGDSVDHPNKYYDRSRVLIKERVKEEEEGGEKKAEGMKGEGKMEVD